MGKVMEAEMDRKAMAGDVSGEGFLGRLPVKITSPEDLKKQLEADGYKGFVKDMFDLHGGEIEGLKESIDSLYVAVESILAILQAQKIEPETLN